MLIQDEKDCRKIFKVQKLDNQVYKRLREYNPSSSVHQSNTLIGLPSYDILLNERYQEMFGYTPYAYSNQTREEIE